MGFLVLRQHHQKALRVIASCRTRAQLRGAEKYCELLMKLHLSSFDKTPNSLKFAYEAQLRESRTKLLAFVTKKRKSFRPE